MAPEELSGEVVRELSKKAVSKGEASSFSERLKGFTWIGYDRNKLTCGEDAIRKAGWINTTTSAGSAEAAMASVKQLGAELIRANLPMDLYIVETEGMMSALLKQQCSQLVGNHTRCGSILGARCTGWCTSAHGW